jgi:D-sedoheptulose 7-phosphate isomerase
MIDIEKTIQEHVEVISGIGGFTPSLAEVAERMVACLDAGGKVLWMGNGGSAADSQHLAAELVGRYTRERKALASIALTTDTSILTAVANDYGYEKIFERQIDALCQDGDIVFGISTSGNSPNVLAAIKLANRIGAMTVGLTGGSGGKLSSIVDHCFNIPSSVTARIQEAHILMGHMLCDWVEASVVNDD